MKYLPDKGRFSHVIGFYRVLWRILHSMTAHVQLGVDTEEVNQNG